MLSRESFAPLNLVVLTQDPETTESRIGDIYFNTARRRIRVYVGESEYLFGSGTFGDFDFGGISSGWVDVA